MLVSGRVLFWMVICCVFKSSWEEKNRAQIPMPPLGLTLAQLRIKRGLGGGKGDKAVKATWKAKDASVGWKIRWAVPNIYHGNLRYPPQATPPRNKAQIRPY